MADLSKIRIPNGTEYNLKDAQARADITALNGSLENKADAETTSSTLDFLMNSSHTQEAGKMLMTTENGVIWGDSSTGISNLAASLITVILQNAIYSSDMSDNINVLYTLLTTGQSGDIDIPATSVTLNRTEITILDIENTVQLVASPIPVITTDTPVWTSSNTNVATVDSNGVVTGVSNGNCVITCTYGNVFAQCSVSCEIGSDLIYKLSAPFTGDGSTTINTGWKIGGRDNPDSGYNTDFTIVYDVEVSSIVSQEMVFVSNVSAAGKIYIKDSVLATMGNVGFNSTTLGTVRASSSYTKTVPIRAKCVRTHVAEAREMSQYFYYITGDTLTKAENFIEAGATLLSNDSNNTVILGGNQNTDGTVLSYMDASITIHDFRIYNRVLSASEISNYLGKDVTE